MSSEIHLYRIPWCWTTIHDKDVERFRVSIGKRSYCTGMEQLCHVGFVIDALLLLALTKKFLSGTCGAKSRFSNSTISKSRRRSESAHNTYSHS